MLISEAALALLFNVTAGLLNRPQAIALTRWGWELFFLHLTYVLIDTERGRMGLRIRAAFRTRLVWPYVISGLVGCIVGIIYWVGISAAYARIFHEGNVDELAVWAFSGPGAYKDGATIAGIPWRKPYSEARVVLRNRGTTSFTALDVLLHLDLPIAGIGQATALPGVSFVINTSITVLPPELKTPGETKSLQTYPPAFSRGYRVRCDNLPPKSNLEVVIATARPSGKGLAVQYKDGSTYWLRTDVDGVTSFDEYFLPREQSKRLHIEGEYRAGEKTVPIRQDVEFHTIGSLLKM